MVLEHGWSVIAVVHAQQHAELSCNNTGREIASHQNTALPVKVHSRSPQPQVVHVWHFACSSNFSMSDDLL